MCCLAYVAPWLIFTWDGVIFTTNTVRHTNLRRCQDVVMALTFKFNEVSTIRTYNLYNLLVCLLVGNWQNYVNGLVREMAFIFLVFIYCTR